MATSELALTCQETKNNDMVYISKLTIGELSESNGA